MYTTMITITLATVVVVQNLCLHTPADVLDRAHQELSSIHSWAQDLDFLSYLVYGTKNDFRTDSQRRANFFSGQSPHEQIFSRERLVVHPVIRYGLPKTVFDPRGYLVDMTYVPMYRLWYGQNWEKPYGCDANAYIAGKYQSPMCIAAIRSGRVTPYIAANLDSLWMLSFHWRTICLLSLLCTGISFGTLYAFCSYLNDFGRRKDSAHLRQYTEVSEIPEVPEKIKNGDAEETDAAYLRRFPKYTLEVPAVGGLLRTGVPTVQDLLTLISHQAHLLMPAVSKRHAHKRTYKSQDYCGLSFPYRTERECISVRVRSVGLDWEIWTPYFDTGFGVPTPAARQSVISGKNFLEANDIVTCIDNDDSVPRHFLDSIAARMATDTGDKAKLYESVISFMRSKLLAEKIDVKDISTWGIYVCSRVNECSVEAGNSVLPNLPFDANVFQRVLYYFRVAAFKTCKFTSMPAWTYPTIFAPSYVVVSRAENVEAREPLRPEAKNPFPDSCPSDGASSDSGSVSSASPVQDEHPNLNGEESAGRTTDPTPDAHGEDTVDAKPSDVVPDATYAASVLRKADPVPVQSGVERGNLDNSEGGSSGRSNNRVVSTDEFTGIAEIMDDFTLYCLPGPPHEPRCRATLEGGSLAEPLKLYGCGACFRTAIKYWRKFGGSPYIHLAKFKTKGRASTCAANCEGISQISPCSTSSPPVPKPHPKRDSQVDDLFGMGEEVPGEEAAGADRGQRKGSGKRSTGKGRRNR